VDLTYGGTGVLRGVSWTVSRGERWVVVGPNGAGKSALLSLILADNPQAYANDVSLFGRRRGSGDTIWEIRRRIGCVSPEMHLYEELERSVLDVIGSGFLDPVGPRRALTGSELRAAEEWVDALDLEHCRGRRLRELSEGERQTALLGRALAKKPELLVLDEPGQGLDAARRSRFLHLLDHELRSNATTLIYVTHDLDEVPSIATHGLLLRQGRSVVQGSADEALRAYRPTWPACV
jgi:molybdate transport system ATP-binding protein